MPLPLGRREGGIEKDPENEPGPALAEEFHIQPSQPRVEGHAGHEVAEARPAHLGGGRPPPEDQQEAAEQEGDEVGRGEERAELLVGDRRAGAIPRRRGDRRRRG